MHASTSLVVYCRVVVRWISGRRLASMKASYNTLTAAVQTVPERYHVVHAGYHYVPHGVSLQRVRRRSQNDAANWRGFVAEATHAAV